MKNVGRKFYHACGGLFLLAVYFAVGRRVAFGIYALFLAAVLAFDLARLSIPAFGKWSQEKLTTLLRPDEEGRTSGSPSYILGIAGTLLLFDLPVATAAVLFLVCGDVAASAVGETWGRTKYLDKSFEGSAAFVAAGMGAGLTAGALGYAPPLPVLFIGTLTAAAAEALTPKFLNDNLTIPLLSGLVMTLHGMVL